MTYKFSTLKQVLDVFSGDELLGPTQIAHALKKSKVIVHKYLKELVAQDKVKKVGEGPQTKYQLTHPEKHQSPKKPPISDLVLPYQITKILDEHFLKRDSTGAIQKGTDGFIRWCRIRNLDPVVKAEAFVKLHNHIQSNYDSCGLLNTSKKFTQHVETMHLDQVYYADQYTWMEFGRGKLAELTFYGKQSQNYTLLTDSISLIKRKLHCLVNRDKIDALAIVPWSIKRENQLLKVLEDELEEFNLPFLKIVKYYPNTIPVPQKSLKTSQERIRNAQQTIFVSDQRVKQFNKILLIDDFVWSWATLNETAGKLKDEGAKHVIGFAFVGNTDLSYEVVKEI